MKENEWISCDERLPKINEKVFVGNKQEDCHVTNIGENVLTPYYDGILYRHAYVWLFQMNGITHWRPIPEKRPDFSKLRDGDLIIFESQDISDCEVSSGFFEKIDNNDYPFCFFIYTKSFACRARLKLEEIKKITRINLEEQKFEEI